MDEPSGTRQRPIRILVHTHPRGEWIAMADVILDCSGWSFHAMGMGPGGGIALGIGKPKRGAFAYSRCIDDRRLQALGSLGSHSRGIGHRSTLRKLGPQHPDLRLTWLVPYAAVGDPLVEEAVRQLQTGLSKSALVPCQNRCTHSIAWIGMGHPSKSRERVIRSSAM